jgi:hypothetical protein
LAKGGGPVGIHNSRVIPGLDNVHDIRHWSVV